MSFATTGASAKLASDTDTGPTALVERLFGTLTSYSRTRLSMQETDRDNKYGAVPGGQGYCS
ncbi:hypothetical protein ACRALDRAFT_1064735 [Sodiomyces alcalophilus JCM 7366]|uniref:uncharacterized protein n=1 Tax=Sodiomyces alcalophilus JCM 7366 TaxID=591952 RepID=UPI0039B606B1